MDTNVQSTIIEERRADRELRASFVEAYEIIRPFFNKANSWGGSSLEHLAYRALHERFPALTGAQVFVFVSAGKRVFESGGNPAP